MEERPIWGIHMGWAFGTQPIDENFVAIGWSQMGDLSKLNPNRETFKKAVLSTYGTEIKQGAIPVVAGTLFKFVNEMQIGDKIIYPSKVDRKVNLGVVEGKYEFLGSSELDCPNRRKIRWTRQFPRPQFSQNALHEIGSAVTLFQVKNNAEEFLAAFEGKPLSSEDVDAETVDEVSVSTIEATEDFIIKRLKTGLSPFQFEKFVAHLLECMGYHARVTPASGDGGVDIIAHRDELGFEDPKIKVQCKQTLSTIGNPDVAQLYGNVGAGEFGLFVTLGDFSPQAKHFERGRPNLRLIGGEDLVDLISSHYEKFEPRYQMLLPLKRMYVPSSVVGQSALD